MNQKDIQIDAHLLAANTNFKTHEEAKSAYSRIGPYQNVDFEFFNYGLCSIPGMGIFRGPFPKSVVPGQYSVIIGSASILGRLVKTTLSEQLSTSEHPVLNLGLCGGSPCMYLNSMTPKMKELLDNSACIIMECMSPKGQANGYYPCARVGDGVCTYSDGRVLQIAGILGLEADKGNLDQVYSIIQNINHSWVEDMNNLLKEYGHKTILLQWSKYHLVRKVHIDNRMDGPHLRRLIFEWPNCLLQESVEALEGKHQGLVELHHDPVFDTQQHNTFPHLYHPNPGTMFNNYHYQPQTIHTRAAQNLDKLHQKIIHGIK